MLAGDRPPGSNPHGDWIMFQPYPQNDVHGPILLPGADGFAFEAGRSSH